ncbi:hypothetical protein AB0F81_09560 [Actinoplanes sp. NPDC024001]|uniref:hypothetical protein n=1 Tax=Actinoplanes sp. NPDC024001 TaxID=3154598 RepID=UPI0033EC7B31
MGLVELSPAPLDQRSREDLRRMLIEGAAIAAIIAGLSRPAQNITIARMAFRDAKPEDRPAIIEALAKTRQFGLWSKPEWSRIKRTRKARQGTPAIEQIQPAPEGEASDTPAGDPF